MSPNLSLYAEKYVFAVESVTGLYFGVSTDQPILSKPMAFCQKVFAILLVVGQS
jgi:hypothetical protein